MCGGKLHPSSTLGAQSTAEVGDHNNYYYIIFFFLGGGGGGGEGEEGGRGRGVRLTWEDQMSSMRMKRVREELRVRTCWVSPESIEV